MERDEMREALHKMYKRWGRKDYLRLEEILINDLNDSEDEYELFWRLMLVMRSYIGDTNGELDYCGARVKKLYGIERRDLETIIEYFEPIAVAYALLGDVELDPLVLPFGVIEYRHTYFDKLMLCYKYYWEHKDREEDWGMTSRLAKKSLMKGIAYWVDKRFVKKYRD